MILSGSLNKRRLKPPRSGAESCEGVGAAHHGLHRAGARRRVGDAGDKASLASGRGSRLQLDPVPGGDRVVGEAVDGRDAIDKVESLGPDVVVMDLKMPQMDGIAATRAIKARWPHVKILGYSSCPTTDLVDAGADLTFQKRDTDDLVEFS